LNASPDQDRETLRQQCSLAVDAMTVAAALGTGTKNTSDPVITNPTEAGRRAASDFALTA
jgi:hypothetical protein